MATTGQVEPEQVEPEQVEPEATRSMLVVDIGKRKRKQVRRLRKGRGRLADRVEQTVERLKADGVLDADAQTVVVVVREKPKRSWMWPR